MNMKIAKDMMREYGNRCVACHLKLQAAMYANPHDMADYKSVIRNPKAWVLSIVAAQYFGSKLPKCAIHRHYLVKTIRKLRKKMINKYTTLPDSTPPAPLADVVSKSCCAPCFFIFCCHLLHFLQMEGGAAIT